MPYDSGTLHQNVTSYYQTVQDFTDGKTVREWSFDKIFQFQYDFGRQVLFDNEWDGI